MRIGSTSQQRKIAMETITYFVEAIDAYPDYVVSYLQGNSSGDSVDFRTKREAVAYAKREARDFASEARGNEAVVLFDGNEVAFYAY
jgi:hypothetical protein